MWEAEEREALEVSMEQTMRSHLRKKEKNKVFNRA